MQKSLKILQFDWLRAFFNFTWETDISQTYSFNRMVKVIMVHDLRLESLYNQLFFHEK